MIFLIIFTAISAWLFHELYWKRRNLPPGPTPIPLIGNLLGLRFPPPGYVSFNRWTKEYNGIYTFWLGGTPYIMISTYDKIKKTFINDGPTYVDKIEQPFQKDFRGGNYGVIETNGDMWTTHRRFALMNLRDMGLGKDLMQERILIEVRDVFEKLDKTLGTEVDIMDKFDFAVGNVINQVTFGYRFDDTNKEAFNKLRNLIEFQNKEFGKFSILIQFFVPFISKIMPGKSINEIFKMFKDDFYAFFNDQIEEHKKKIDFDSEENSDYCEAYLKEQRKREAEGDFETFGNMQLSNMCLDIWFAGLVTTTTTISWTFAYLLNTPGVQEKIHEELDRVIGSDRLITTADKNDLPYMTAFINESQRCANIIPINLFHCTTKDTVIDGYPVKKGTGVIAQISSVMTDEKTFPEPFKFNPDRFIEDGKLKKVEEVVPFSVGKRMCLGEGLARMELFLFISNFLNRYRILPGKDGVPCIDKTKDIVVKPRVFGSVLEKRHV